jgi:hypothetical protein
VIFFAGLPYCVASRVARGEFPEGSDRSRFQFKDIGDKSLGLWYDDRPVLVYNFGEKSLPGVRAAGTRSSYVHPIYGTEGEILTDDFPADHYHHHGLFWGWPHVSIDSREYDLWKMRGIRIEFKRWAVKETDAFRAVLAVENEWLVRDKPVVEEELWLEVTPAREEGWFIDVDLSWKPTTAPVTLVGAEGKSYGGLTLRFAPRTETTITTPDGRASEDLLMTKLPWADLSARFRGASQPSGATVFVAPDHPDFPPEWMTRDYGVLAVGWPGIKSKTIEPGETVTCRYRVWIHKGSPDAAEIAKVYDDFTAYLKARSRHK